MKIYNQSFRIRKIKLRNVHRVEKAILYQSNEINKIKKFIYRQTHYMLKNMNL